ncbi:MAG TPA: hypothetical protein DEP35_22555 [Deltaproteobacteria bacterium]|nr:hypothetical protein [Deltaproteobacteria bacterium]
MMEAGFPGGQGVASGTICSGSQPQRRVGNPDAQEAVHTRALAAASQRWGSEGSISQGAEPGGARHRLCSTKRGEAMHHGAEPVSEEKVE